MAKKKKIKSDSKVGYGKPPKEHCFKKGESGNPNGPPKHRMQLWTYLCRYANMTDAEFDKLKKGKLMQSQQAAIKLIENLKEGKYSPSGKLARHIFDREEGRPTEHIIVGSDATLTDEECSEVRKALLKRC